jgi:hypothetical protein
MFDPSQKLNRIHPFLSQTLIDEHSHYFQTYSVISSRSSLADEVAGAGLALPLHQVEPLLAETAGVVLPLQAVLELAQPVDEVVVGRAGLAELALVLEAAVDDAGAALELVVRQAVDADSAVVLEAALLHLLAVALLSEVVAALAGDAAEVVVALALLDGAAVAVEQVGLVALRAGVVRLLHLAPQQVIVLALVEDQRVLR